MRQERLKNFNDARFGMFIHWGLYSILGRGEWVRYQEDIPPAEYAKLAQQFNPRRYDPRAWARIAREAGMRYMVLTAKHHDGFCLFDSEHTDFTSVRTAARRDFVAEYLDACRAEGLMAGLYFSVKDWSVPAYFRGPDADASGWQECVDRFHRQTLELMSNYGPIDILFYDCADDADFRGGWGERTAEVWDSEALNAKVRQLQPGILINDRSGLPEDYGTPEQTVPMEVPDGTRMYESCVTMNDNWGYAIGDGNWKSTGLLIRQLIACAARGSNYLLNVGPDPDGVIPAPSVERLREMGGWLRTHGKAVYGTERLLPNYFDVHSTGRITTKGHQAFLTLDQWAATGEIVMTQLANEVLAARLLPTGEQLAVHREGRRVFITGLPAHPPARHVSVVELDLDGPARPQYHSQ
jgi:alpha-L-fucosidase